MLEILKNKIKTVKKEAENLYLVGPIHLPVNIEGETLQFKWYCWLTCNGPSANTPEEIVQKLTHIDLAQMQQSSVLVYGDFDQEEDALIRFHSICHTGDIFHSKRCDCGFQLNESLKHIANHGVGALFYLANHEGRGIGLFSKAMAYVLQENGYDTVEANLALGFKDDARDYSDAISILKELREKPVTLITNNPKKLHALQEAGMNLTGRIEMWGDRSEYNEKYLDTKVNKSGHIADK